MDFQMVHVNLNVIDLEKSVNFYRAALGLLERRRFQPADGSFELVYLSDEADQMRLELTWLAGRDTPYDLSDNEIHIAFQTPDFDAAYQKHQAMGCIAMDNKSMGIYFIQDPDGYWLEIVPEK